MIKHFINLVGSSYVFSNKFLIFFLETITWIFVNWNTRFVYNEVFRLLCINDFLKFSCQINALTWTFDLNDAFSNISRNFFMFFEGSNLWTSDLIAVFSNIFFKFLALDVKLNLRTFIISNASSNIFEEFRMFFNNASLLCNDDNNLMFNVDVFS